MQGVRYVHHFSCCLPSANVSRLGSQFGSLVNLHHMGLEVAMRLAIGYCLRRVGHHGIKTLYVSRSQSKMAEREAGYMHLVRICLNTNRRCQVMKLR